MAYSNPVPVGVAVVPVSGGLLGIKRNIEPRKGHIAFPGGYISSGEKFVEALSRETLEETGIIIAPSKWEIFHIGDSIGSDRILIFGKCKELQKIDFSFTSDETSEVVVIKKDTPLAFPLHEEARDIFFQK